MLLRGWEVFCLEGFDINLSYCTGGGLKVYFFWAHVHNKFSSHRIHIWYIYLHLVDILWYM